MPSQHFLYAQLPRVALLLITAGCIGIYFWCTVPQGHWYHLGLHVACFAPWTIAWHLSVRQPSGWRPPWLVVVAVPVALAILGELVQVVLPAMGHSAEIKGVLFSLAGVVTGWLCLWLWLWLWTARRSVRTAAA
jgi:hypothetical protein